MNLAEVVPNFADMTSASGTIRYIFPRRVSDVGSTPSLINAMLVGATILSGMVPMKLVKGLMVSNRGS
jgi:hypothetical protein